MHMRIETPTSVPTVATASKQVNHETPFTTDADHKKNTLAILCFRNLSNDPASSFYEFSLADAVITELARIRSLVVRPSSVIAKYQGRSEEHTSELQSPCNLVCRLLLEKKNL